MKYTNHTQTQHNTHAGARTRPGRVSLISSQWQPGIYSSAIMYFMVLTRGFHCIASLVPCCFQWRRKRTRKTDWVTQTQGWKACQVRVAPQQRQAAPLKLDGKLRSHTTSLATVRRENQALARLVVKRWEKRTEQLFLCVLKFKFFQQIRTPGFVCMQKCSSGLDLGAVSDCLTLRLRLNQSQPVLGFHPVGFFLMHTTQGGVNKRHFLDAAFCPAVTVTIQAADFHLQGHSAATELFCLQLF